MRDRQADRQVVQRVIRVQQTVVRRAMLLRVAHVRVVAVVTRAVVDTQVAAVVTLVAGTKVTVVKFI